MTGICTVPIDHPAAWTSAAIGGKEGLMHRLAPEHVEVLHELVAKTGHLPADRITRQDFAHPLIEPLMSAVRDTLMNGRGAVILGGLDARRFSLEDFGRVYWGLGTYLGDGAPQSYRRDRIGYVQKEEDNPTGRGYLMDVELRPHTDFHEILSLASYRRAATGGASGLVSSLAIHNAILESHPEHLRALYEGFYCEWGGGKAVTDEKVPLFCYVDGKVSCYYHLPAFLHGATVKGIAVPDNLRAAVAYFDSQADRADLRANFMLEPGEMVFWHNFTALHSRTAFQNTDQQKRLLLRLWINVANGRPMHPAYSERARLMDLDHEGGRASIDYVVLNTLAQQGANVR